MKLVNPEIASRMSLLTILEHGAKSLTFLAAALLIISVFYDYSYLSAIGLSFNEIPSLTTEHVRSALLWGPSLIIVICSVVFRELLDWRIESIFADQLVTRESSYYDVKKNKSPPKALIVPIALMGVVPVLLTGGEAWIYYVPIPLTSFFVIYIINDDRLSSISRTVKLIVGLFPLFLGMVGAYGDHQGNMLIRNRAPNWELSIRIGTATTKKTLTGLRRFSTFAIIVDSDRFISIIPNDSILSARRLAPAISPVSNICRWFNFSCDSVKSS
jgi:hypothetical protein